uniref:Uncharacterized protein n=1 Tax=Rhizophora mucronata TaxID=61149 RepID=A0A2P2QEX0_RHIMU
MFQKNINQIFICFSFTIFHFCLPILVLIKDILNYPVYLSMQLLRFRPQSCNQFKHWCRRVHIRNTKT